MGKAMRLDKLLGHTGWGTRKELKDLCKSGQVTVNGAICRDSSRKVDPEADVVAVGGEIVSYEEYIYLMLYKPSGVADGHRPLAASVSGEPPLSRRQAG